MLKKMMLLAMALAALAAFAVPVTAASASTQWTTNGEPIGEIENGDQVHLTGTLSVTKSNIKFSCDVTANAYLWNDPELGAHGLVTLTWLNQHGATTGCTVAVNVGSGYVDIAGCHVKPSSTGSDWTISTSTGGNAAISEFNITYEFNGCSALGIPNGTKLGALGTATGTVDGGCIVFNQSGDLKEATVVEVKIDGTLCPTEPGLDLTG